MRPAVNPTDQYIAFDLELTGITPGLDRVIEVGAVHFDSTGNILGTFERLVHSPQPSSPTAQSIHGIADELLRAAQPASIVLPQFVTFLGDPKCTTLIAHHAASDAGFLGHELSRSGLAMPAHRIIDTLAWSRRIWPEYGNHRLESLSDRIGSNIGTSHRALADSYRVFKLFSVLQKLGKHDERPPLAYSFYDNARELPTPRGWESVAEAMTRNGVVQIAYNGGSRGIQPRLLRPQKFAYRGGVAYLSGFCHFDNKLKSFQLERILDFQVLASTS